MRSVQTTQLLSPEAQRTGRYVASGLIVFLVATSIVLDIRERRQAAQPVEAVKYVLIVATPTLPPPAPTSAPAPVIAPPTLAPAPTLPPPPTVIYQPVYIEVQQEAPAAPAVNEPTPIPGWFIHEPAQPVQGGCVRTRGGGLCQLAQP